MTVVQYWLGWSLFLAVAVGLAWRIDARLAEQNRLLRALLAGQMAPGNQTTFPAYDYFPSGTVSRRPGDLITGQQTPEVPR